MSLPNDGGPAFPFPGWDHPANSDGNIYPELGMSLRDYFAARAPAMPTELNDLAREEADIDNPDKTHREKSEVLLSIRAEWNYMYADEMIAARSAGGK